MLANSLALLIVGRVLQGIGTAGVNPLCIAVIAQLFPDHQRGSALATWSSTGPATGMIAPFVGGMLVDFFGWQAIFWTGIVAAVVAMWFVRGRCAKLAPHAEPGFFQCFDWAGMGLLSGAIIVLVAYLSSCCINGRGATARSAFGVGNGGLGGGFAVVGTASCPPVDST